MKNSWKLIALSFVIAFNFFIGYGNSSHAQDSSREDEAFYVAQRAFEDGFYDVSLSLLERFQAAYPVSPKFAQADLLIGQCYYFQNKFLEALKKFEGLLNSAFAGDIKDAATYWIAEVHFKGNNFVKAGQYYKTIIDNYPKSRYYPAAYYSLGWCFFQEEMFDEALGYFKAVEEKFPAEAQDASFKIIECLYNLKEYAKLKARLGNYIKIYASDNMKMPYMYFYLAEAEYYLNNFQAAIDDYSKVMQNSRDERLVGLSRLGQAWSHLKLKQYDLAEGAFGKIKISALEKPGRDVLLLGRAVLLFETARFSEAKNMYDELIQVAPEAVILMQAYLGKGDAFYKMAEYADAKNTYKAALDRVVPEALPGEIIDRLHYGLAWAFLKEGEFKEAISEFQKIAKNTEDKVVKVSALCQIGDTYQDSGDYAKALDAYDAILKDYPDSFYGDYVQYQVGLTLLKSSNYDGAIMSFLAFKKKFPDSKLLDDVVYALGLAYFQKQDYRASREVFVDFTSRFKGSSIMPQAMYLLGTSLFNLGKYQDAIEVFKNIAREYAHDLETVQKAEYEIADCYYQMGEEKEAMSRFKTLRAKYPDSSLTPEIMWWLGEYYYRHNDLDLARRYFSSLIRDFPKSGLIADAYYVLGSIAQEESKYPEAIDYFKKVMGLGRTDLSGQAIIATGDIYSKQDNTGLALSTYQDAVKQYPNLGGLIYPKIAGLFYRGGNYADSLEFYRKSLDIVPVKEMPEVQFKIAEILEAQGKTEEAIEEYLRVTYLYSDNSDSGTKAFLRLAKIYEDRENFAEALNIYNKISVTGVPEAKYAKERIEWIIKGKKVPPAAGFR